MATSVAAELNEFGILLEVLGHTGPLSVCWLDGKDFIPSVHPTREKAMRAADRHKGQDCWFGVNPIREVLAGRGGADDVLGLNCLWADLDVKPGGLPSYGAAQEVIDKVSDLLEATPVAVVHSGHGMQPYWLVIGASWAVDDHAARQRASQVLARFHAVVARVAADLGGAVDNVYDLSRILRVPGTINIKEPTQPVPVLLAEYSPYARPLAFEELERTLATASPEWPFDQLSTEEAVDPDRADLGTPGRQGGSPWSDVPGTLAKGRHHGVIALAGALVRRGGMTPEEGVAYMRNLVFPLIEQTAAGHPYPLDEFEGDVGDVFARYAETPGEEQGRRHLQLTRASDIRPEPVVWLWSGRFALGTLNLLAGREGLGKSMLALWVAAQVTNGTLPGELLDEPRSVLIVATEDSWTQTIVPRLMAVKADLNRVFRVDAVFADGFPIGVELPGDLLELGKAIAAYEAALVLFDPLLSRLDGSLDTHKDSDVRRSLEPLVALAGRTEVAILGLMHFNKSGSDDPMNALMASRAFSAVARTVSTVVRDPDDEDVRAFGTPKNNLGRTDLPTLTFMIESRHVETDTGMANPGRIVWGEATNRSISELMQQNNASTKLSDAGLWLRDFLEECGGSAKSAFIKEEGEREGFTLNAIHRARGQLNLGVAQAGFPKESTWSLRGKAAPVVAADATTEMTGTTEMTDREPQS